MIDLNLIILIITTLNVNGINILFKRQRLNKRIRHNHILFIRNILLKDTNRLKVKRKEKTYTILTKIKNQKKNEETLSLE